MNLFEYLDASPKERLIEIKRVLNLTLENPNAETDTVSVFVKKANSIQTVKSILNNTMEIGFMEKRYKDIIYNVANLSLEDLKDIKNLLSDCMEKLQSRIGKIITPKSPKNMLNNTDSIKKARKKLNEK